MADTLMARKIFLIKTVNGIKPGDDHTEKVVRRWKLGAGYALTYKEARSLQYHRLIFGIATAVVDNAPEGSYWHGKLPEHFIKAVMLTIGCVDEIMDMNGEVHLIPKSIAFENMSDEEFRPIGDAVIREGSRILNVPQHVLLENFGGAA